MRDGIDEYTLLCEDCGYVIEGLPREGQCPECGKAVAESLPERRTGTAWQQSNQTKDLIRTWVGTLRHPFRTLDALRIDQSHGDAMLQAAAAVSALGMVGVVFAFFSIFAHGLSAGLLDVIASPELWLLSVVAFVATYVAVFVLTMIERRGVRFIGKRRGWRITPAIAASVCGQGSVGWVVGALGFAFFAWLGLFAYQMQLGSIVEVTLLIAGPAALVAGFLFFEVFAYLGLRRCRFANRVRRDGSPTPHGDSAEEVEKKKEARR